MVAKTSLFEQRSRLQIKATFFRLKWFLDDDILQNTSKVFRLMFVFLKLCIIENVIGRKNTALEAWLEVFWDVSSTQNCFELNKYVFFFENLIPISFLMFRLLRPNV